MAIESRGRFGERSARLDAPALQPREPALAPHARGEAAAALREALARSRAPEAVDVPRDQARARREVRVPTDVGERAVVKDGLLRKPFERRVVLQIEAHPLPGPGAR